MQHMDGKYELMLSMFCDFTAPTVYQTSCSSSAP